MVASLWLRLLECLTRQFLEEPHLTRVTFTFSLLLYMYLLDHLSIGTFYQKGQFGVLLLSWFLDSYK